ncbi:hypothetical protein EDB83DRAFT_1950268 [Lactarius deliciosus]|nr:hypothetical protein EDB83DRAFT_1950268 [Lactarius deliciosus]
MPILRLPLNRGFILTVDPPTRAFGAAPGPVTDSLSYKHIRTNLFTRQAVSQYNFLEFLTAHPDVDLLRRHQESAHRGSPIGQSSPVTDAPNTREGSTNSPTASSPSASSNFELPASRFLQLINSEQVPRYTKDVTVSLEGTYFEIPPLTRTFPYSPEQMSLEQGSLKEDCAPWVPATHPEGALYFFDQDRRLFTDTDMHDPVLREEMEDFYHYLQRILDRDGVAIPSNNYDLALDIVRLEDGRTSWSYYYACHETRCLFWLDPYDATYMTLEVFGLKSPAHIKHRLESLYWCADCSVGWTLSVFKGRRLGHAIIDELLGMLSHGCMDILTSKSSTLPYDSDTMHKMLKLVQNAKESDAGLVYHTAGVTRSLSFFGEPRRSRLPRPLMCALRSAHWRFLYFHGQSSARLEKNEKTYSSEKQKRTLLITSLSPALFFAPEGYLRELEKKCLDETIIEGNWGHVISGLLEEWEQLVLPSTVMLSANVGFLATPGVVISNLNSNITGTNQVVIFTSPAQIASCMSIVASAGSIMIALLLIRHSNPKRKGDLTNAASYLYANTHQPFGLEPMAIIFSLPWALLLFSMVAFFVALLLFCFGTSNASTRIFVAVTSVVVALPIGLCIKSPWGSSNAMETWFSRIKLSITHALDSTCATYHRIAALIDFGPHRGSPSSPTSDPAGSAHSMPDHVGVVNV